MASSRANVPAYCYVGTLKGVTAAEILNDRVVPFYDEHAVRLRRVLNRSEKEWIMPPREWCMAKAQFAVLFGERFTRAMA